MIFEEDGAASPSPTPPYITGITQDQGSTLAYARVQFPKYIGTDKEFGEYEFPASLKSKLFALHRWPGKQFIYLKKIGVFKGYEGQNFKDAVDSLG